MGQYAVSSKRKGSLLNTGFSVYRRCNEQARDIIGQAVADGTNDLKGYSVKDPKRTKLIEQIINLIAKDIVYERNGRKVEILSAIHSCERNEEETSSDFLSRFKSLISRYAVQISTIDEEKSSQFALLLVRNARLSPTV